MGSRRQHGYPSDTSLLWESLAHSSAYILGSTCPFLIVVLSLFLPPFSVCLPPFPSTSEPATRVLSLSCQRSHNEHDDILRIAYLCSESSLVPFCFSTAYLSKLQIDICSQTLQYEKETMISFSML